MSGDASSFSALAERYRKLGASDRRAVLANFSTTERQVFERRLAAELEAQRRKRDDEQRADRQFAGYSPSIAAKVELAVRGKAAEPSSMTQACATAVARAHTQNRESAGQAGHVQTLRNLVLRLLFPSDGERK